VAGTVENDRGSAGARGCTTSANALISGRNS
jgi:hypothetical protein